MDSRGHPSLSRIWWGAGSRRRMGGVLGGWWMWRWNRHRRTAPARCCMGCTAGCTASTRCGRRRRPWASMPATSASPGMAWRPTTGGRCGSSRAIRATTSDHGGVRLLDAHLAIQQDGGEGPAAQVERIGATEHIKRGAVAVQAQLALVKCAELLAEGRVSLGEQGYIAGNGGVLDNILSRI